MKFFVREKDNKFQILTAIDDFMIFLNYIEILNDDINEYIVTNLNLKKEVLIPILTDRNYSTLVKSQIEIKDFDSDLEQTKVEYNVLILDSLSTFFNEKDNLLNIIRFIGLNNILLTNNFYLTDTTLEKLDTLTFLTKDDITFLKDQYKVIKQYEKVLNAYQDYRENVDLATEISEVIDNFNSYMNVFKELENETS
jgi:hypothetical protein